MASSRSNPRNEDETPPSLEDLYHIELLPSELFLKFRKHVQGFRVGLNLEFYNYQGNNEFEAKMVLKPMEPHRRWKFICEPIRGDIRVLSKKIPITKYLNLQVGMGHNFHLNAIGWKWRLTSCWGGDGISQIRNKTSMALFPGCDLRLGWKAEYILPEIHGGIGTGERAFNFSYGRLNASLDRIEAVITHSPSEWKTGIQAARETLLDLKQHSDDNVHDDPEVHSSTVDRSMRNDQLKGDAGTSCDNGQLQTC